MREEGCHIVAENMGRDVVTRRVLWGALAVAASSLVTFGATQAGDDGDVVAYSVPDTIQSTGATTAPAASGDQPDSGAGVSRGGLDTTSDAETPGATPPVTRGTATDQLGGPVLQPLVDATPPVVDPVPPVTGIDEETPADQGPVEQPPAPKPPVEPAPVPVEHAPAPAPEPVEPAPVPEPVAPAPKPVAPAPEPVAPAPAPAPVEPPVVTPPVVTPPVETPPVVTPPVVTPPVETPPVVTPPVEVPPVVTPPVETPPVQTPPVESPPVVTPPVETPPVDAPPVEAPPVEVPPVVTPPVPVTPAEAPPIEQTPARVAPVPVDVLAVVVQQSIGATPAEPAQPVAVEVISRARHRCPGPAMGPNGIAAVPDNAVLLARLAVLAGTVGNG